MHLFEFSPLHVVFLINFYYDLAKSSPNGLSDRSSNKFICVFQGYFGDLLSRDGKDHVKLQPVDIFFYPEDDTLEIMLEGSLLLRRKKV